MIAKQKIKNALKLLLGEKRYVRLVRWLWPRTVAKKYGGVEIIHDIHSGAGELRSVLAAGMPAAIGKIGASELRVCLEAERIDQTQQTGFSSSVKHEIHLHSGIFPPTDPVLSKFAALYTEECGELDLLAAWFIEGERQFVERYVPRSRFISLLALEPYLAPNPPWTHLLANKRVLVISPFSRSIETQYARREKVWANLPGVLPEWKLRTIRAPLSDYLSPSSFLNWFEALEHLKKEMEREVFDVAIVGAGAFSIPLIVHAKRLGSIGIHLGGATQILFGVAGGRWEENEVLRPLINESWVRPSGDEVPPKFKKMEGGCYW